MYRRKAPLYPKRRSCPADRVRGDLNRLPGTSKNLRHQFAARAVENSSLT
jgi:hypothetical protein